MAQLTKVITCEPGELRDKLESPEVDGLRLIGMVPSEGRSANGQTWPVLQLVFDLSYPGNESARIAELKGQVLELEEEDENLKQHLARYRRALQVIADNMPEVANLVHKALTQATE